MGNLLRGIIGGVIGGAIGAAAWAAVSYSTNYELGILAWVVGVLVGIGCAIGFRGDQNEFSGGVAAVIAIAAILAGKYAAVHFVVVDIMRNNSGSMQVTDDDLKVSLADQLVEEYEQGGKPVKWPEGMDVETASSQADYPPDLWADMLTRWAQLTPQEIEQRRAWITRNQKDALASFQSEIAREGFFSTFSFFDIIWAILAIGSAYKIGSGEEGN